MEEKKEIEQLELTEKTVPKAVGYLINEVAEMRATLEDMKKQLMSFSTCPTIFPTKYDYFSLSLLR